MTFDQIIIWVIAAGAVIGAADKIFGNRLGLGRKFDEGFQAMGRWPGDGWNRLSGSCDCGCVRPCDYSGI